MFGTRNLLSLSSGFWGSLAEEAILIPSLLQLTCVNQTVQLIFSFAAITSLNTSLTNNISLSYLEFRDISLIFTPGHFILYTDENDFSHSLVLGL